MNKLYSIMFLSSLAIGQIHAQTPAAELAITKEPASTLVAMGQSASINVEADGPGTLAYQWFHGETSLTNGDHFQGADTATLIIDPVEDSDSGYYSVQVSEGSDTVTSKFVSLKILPPDEVANKVAQAWPVAVPPAIDGVMDDSWLAAPENTLDAAITKPLNDLVAPDNAADLSGTWRALWNASYLYLFIEVQDDSLVLTPGNNFEIFTSSAYTRIYGEWGNSGLGINDVHVLCHLENSPLDLIHALYSYGDPESVLDGTTISVVPTATGYNAEVALTWNSLNIAPEMGVSWDGVYGKFVGGPSDYLNRSYIGFELSLQDSDSSSGLRESKVAWYGGPEQRHGDYAWADTQVWGTLALAGDPSDPSISDAPISQTVNFGASAVFSVTTQGSSEISYQWQMLDSDGVTWVDIPDATESTYTFDANEYTLNGHYFRVTVTGIDGSISSNPAMLTITTLFEGTSTTTDLGNGFMWNTLFGYMYNGFYPFEYLFGTDSWLYIYGDSEANGYFFFNFTTAKWNWTAGEYYPYYLEYPGQEWKTY